MCRISGIVFKQNPNWTLLYKMAEHQTKGGPDHTGFWIDGNVGFGHNRLSIIDTSDKGNQPMETDRWVLTYNGEIYNYQNLRTKISPRQWKSYNDAETLLFYIDQYGFEKTIQDIEGMYAFAAYDKFEQKLYLHVDHLSIKPLYIYNSPEMFAFASSPGALTHLKDKWNLSYIELDTFLALGSTVHGLFSGTTKVCQGSYVVFNTVTSVVDEFESGEDYKTVKTSKEELKKTLIDSIESVRQSDVPVFMFLSGGIDSSVVASRCPFMNAVHLASPEVNYAKQVAEKYGNPLMIVEPSDYSAKECLEDYAKQSGDCSMSALIPYVVSKEVSKFAKVAISSNGADEIFVGYDRIKNTVTEGQFHHIFREYFVKRSPFWGYNDYYSSRLLELRTYVQFDLNKTLDFASMCHGLEVRVPYLNKSVVQAALSISYNQHVNGLGNKTILKEILKEEGFDDQFLQRPKVGFSMHYSPADYEDLQIKGKQLLKDQFNIDPVFRGPYSGRDERYYSYSAAAFYCWFEVWNHKLIL